MKITAKKVTVTVIIIAVLLLIFNPLSIVLLGIIFQDVQYKLDKTADKYTTDLKTPTIARMTADYITEKYGGSYSNELEQVMSSYCWEGGGGSLFRSPDGYVYCIERDGERTFYDNYQYPEIKAALGSKIESYFSDHSGKLISNLIAVYEESYYIKDTATEYYMFSTYFDGDIDKFIKSKRLSVIGYVTIEGEKLHKTDYIDDMEIFFDDFETMFTPTSLHIRVKDKALTLPNLPNEHYKKEFTNDSEIDDIDFGHCYDIPTGARFLESLVYGYSHPSKYGKEQERKLYSPDYSQYDENTDISICQLSSEKSAPLSVAAFDMDEISVLKSERKAQSPKSDETPLKVSGKALEINYSGRDYPVLRLDREFYGLSENSVPLLLEEGCGDYAENTYYRTLGWVGEAQGETLSTRDLSFDGWYYMDDDYFYVAYPYCSKHTIIAFADAELEIKQ